MTVLEAGIALEFLFSTLQNDTTLTSLVSGVFRTYAPPSTNPPYVVIAQQSSQDTLTMNAYRVMTTSLYQIKAVGPASIMSTLISAATEIDQQLRLASGTATGGLILSCYREQVLQIDQLVNGVLWTDLGGLYRIQIQQTS